MLQSQKTPKSQQLSVTKDCVSLRENLWIQGTLQAATEHSGCLDLVALPSQTQSFLNHQGGVDASFSALWPRSVCIP